MIKHNNAANRFFAKIPPIILTEAHTLKLNTKSWGVLTEYYLESVKVNSFAKNNIVSIAILRVGDIAGQVTLIIKGPSVGLLFGLSTQKWKEVEMLSQRDGQIFYRYFKDGLKDSFSYEQQLFYSFCASNQKKDLLVAVFERTKNTRRKDCSEALLNVLELCKPHDFILDIYHNHLQKKCDCL